MDLGHLRHLRARVPAALRTRVRLFLHPLDPEVGLGRSGAREVPDPYYSDQAAYELVLDLVEAVEAALGLRPLKTRPLGGGCIAEVAAVDLPDGRRLVVKRGPPRTARPAGGDPSDGGAGGLALEGWMLGVLGRHGLRVPEVLYADAELLVMTRLDAGGRLDTPNQGQAGEARTAEARTGEVRTGEVRTAEIRAAEAIAALHAHTAPAFGLERDTVIGGLPQPNAWLPRWLPFFAERRLLHMAGLAAGRGRLPGADLARVERLAGRLERYLGEPARPALLHGDLWGGNVLVGADGRPGFIDPAIYYGHPEVELAFTTLFGTFGRPFFRRYAELAPLEPDFFEVRRDLYNLYPLLVHVALFGGGYLDSVRRVLDRYVQDPETPEGAAAAGRSGPGATRSVPLAVKLLRWVERLVLLAVAVFTVMAAGVEVLRVVETGSVVLADLLLMFLYAEVIGMVAVFYLSRTTPLFYPIFIAITAIARLIVLQSKEMDPLKIIYEAAAILLLAGAVALLKRFAAD
ncbi:unnamed protein product [Symbiodinium pilosum]|uniref:protein-ribulosamine 3-kinase n=1 Tax=Symbiodinium pilosum TaxID=2952 RepID=A0A812NV06_SYMPI|nr:unnamed protein product [Symbiodinium pilosum]